MSESDLLTWAIFLVTIFCHELGHYIDAKRQGIYMGVFFNGLTAGICLSGYMKHRWNYLGGIIYSFLIYPIILVLVSYGVLVYQWVWVFPLLAIALGGLDLLVFFAYKPAWHNHKVEILKRNKVNKFLVKAFNLRTDIVWVDY